MFCINNKTNPIPSSIAENINEKKVKESIEMLLKIKPMKKKKTYNVIQKSSAVRSRCNEVFELTIILKIIRKKKKNSMFKLSTIIKTTYFASSTQRSEPRLVSS